MKTIVVKIEENIILQKMIKKRLKEDIIDFL